MSRTGGLYTRFREGTRRVIGALRSPLSSFARLLEAFYYQTDKGYVVYPENWMDSYYGALDALANLLTYGDASDADKAAVKAAYADLQQEIFADFDTMKAAVAAADTTQAKQAAATEASKAMAEKVHAKTLALYEDLLGEK